MLLTESRSGSWVEWLHKALSFGRRQPWVCVCHTSTCESFCLWLRAAVLTGRLLPTARIYPCPIDVETKIERIGVLNIITIDQRSLRAHSRAGCISMCWSQATGTPMFTGMGKTHYMDPVTRIIATVVHCPSAGSQPRIRFPQHCPLYRLLWPSLIGAIRDVRSCKTF